MSDSRVAADQSEAPSTRLSQPPPEDQPALTPEEAEAQQAAQAPQEGQFPEGQSPADQAAAMKEGVFDPGDHTVDDVVEYATAHPDEVDEIYEAETAGKNRSTLVSQLEAMTQPESSEE